MKPVIEFKVQGLSELSSGAFSRMGDEDAGDV